MLTSNSLKQQIAAKKAEEEALHGSASYHRVMGSERPAYIEFRPTAKTRVGFALAQLCHYTLEPNPYPELSVAPERLTIAFSAADVMVYGARLGPLVDDLAKHCVDWITTVDERYMGMSERPWVGRIDIQPCGKQNPPPPSSDDHAGPIPLPPDPVPTASTPHAVRR